MFCQNKNIYIHNIKKCSDSLVMRETKTQTVMRHHYPSIRMTQREKCWQGGRATRTPIYFRWKCKLPCSLKNCLAVSAGAEWIHGLLILGRYATAKCPQVHQKMCITMLTAALVIITPNWKLPNWPSIQEGKIMVYSYNEILSSSINNLQAQEQYGWISSTQCWAKEARYKRLHIYESIYMKYKTGKTCVVRSQKHPWEEDDWGLGGDT